MKHTASTGSENPHEPCQPIALTYVPAFIQQFVPDSENVYMLTVVPGLETVAADEAVCKLKTATRAILRGKVVISSPDEADYTLLRCADNVYAFLCAGRIGATRDALCAFDAALKKASFEQAWRIWLSRQTRQSGPANARSPLLSDGHSPFFTVSASVAGKCTYSRFEAAEAFAKVISRHYGGRYGPHFHDAYGDNVSNAPIAFRLDLIGGFFMLSVKLTDAAFRFRGTKRLFGKAALRPTVAHALVWTAGLAEGESFLDPFCGSGTIVCERAAYPHKQLIASDCDPAAITHTRHNLSLMDLSQAGADTLLLTVDVNDLSLERHSVDCIVTNPPWGGQIQTADAFALYRAFMRKADECLNRNGRVVTLTPLGAILERAADAYGFSSRVLFTVSLHGTVCYVYRLVRGNNIQSAPEPARNEHNEFIITKERMIHGPSSH